MAALGVRLDAIRIDPGQGRGQQAEIEVVRDCIGGTGLAAGTADLLLDLFEARLDLPAGAIVFDDLGHREGQVRGYQSALVIGQFSAGISVKIVHSRPDQYSGNSYSSSPS